MKTEPKRARWNRASVVERAGDLADQEGLDALTLTRLAEVLGIRPPSLFNHVDSLGGLIRDLAVDAMGRLADQLEAKLAEPHSPEQGLLGMMDDYRSFVHAHPGRYGATLAAPAALAVEDPTFASVESRFMELGLRLAGEFGLKGDDAVHTLRAWRAIAHGFSNLERNQGFGIPLDCDESYRRAVAALTPPRDSKP